MGCVEPLSVTVVFVFGDCGSITIRKLSYAIVCVCVCVCEYVCASMCVREWSRATQCSFGRGIVGAMLGCDMVVATVCTVVFAPQ